MSDGMNWPQPVRQAESYVPEGFTGAPGKLPGNIMSYLGNVRSQAPVPTFISDDERYGRKLLDATNRARAVRAR